MREVCEGGDIVIREVDCILILSRINHVNMPPKKGGGRRGGLTLAIPKFSIEGILCPIQRLKKERKEPIYQWCSHV